MASTLFIDELWKRKKELERQLREVEAELTSSKNGLLDLAAENKKVIDEASHWKMVAAKSEEKLKSTKVELKTLQEEVEFKLPFAVLKGRLDLFKEFQEGRQFDYSSEIANLECILSEVEDHQAEGDRLSKDEYVDKVVVTVPSEGGGD